MAVNEQLRWPAVKGFYLKHELQRLCSCLGYPNNLFLDCLHTASTTNASLRYEYLQCLAVKPLAERCIKQLLESKHLHQYLEKRFNRHDSKYNIKLIRKAMWLLRHFKMSFSEISEARIAFELYSSEDGSGLLADGETVLAAIKMLNKVISPSKLECEIQKQQHVVDTPSRIQLYEFFSLVLLAQNAVDVEKEMNSESMSPVNEEIASIVSLTDLDQALMTSDQKLLAYLEKQYKSSLYKKIKPKPDIINTEYIVSAAPRRELKTQSQEQFHALTPSLELTQCHLHQARGGEILGDVPSSRAGKCTSAFQQVSTSILLDDKSHQHAHSRAFSRAKWHSQSKQSIKKIPQVFLQSQSVDTTKRSKQMFDETGCVKSVLKAREALMTSFSSIAESGHTNTSLFEIPQLHSSEVTGTNQPWRAPNLVRHMNTWLYEPIISPEEVQYHQGLINELRWSSLRLSPIYDTNTTQPPTSMKVDVASPRKPSSRVRFH